MSERALKQGFLIAAIFAIAAFLVYGPSLWNGFVRWDDGLLIYQNPAVVEISPRSIALAFSTYDPELYIPLTLLSYQVDHLLGAGDPFPFHLTSLLLHLSNALLVGWLLWRLVGNKWAGLGAGLLFLLHPLHTEAVAWASGRKDVLSALFFLGSLHAYLSYRESEGRRPYIWSLVFFLLGLLSKVVVITLPLVLILLDLLERRRFDRRAIVEKLPYLGLSVLFGIVAYFGKTHLVESTTLLTKILMAAKSTVFYLWKFVVPTKLSVLYVQPGIPPLTSPDVLLAFAVTGLLIAAALISLWKRRLLFFGIAFYLLTVAPTFINFAKGEGDFYVASDRYAYLPSIGFLFLIACALKSFLPEESDLPRTLKEKASAGILVILTVLLGFLSYRQSLTWRDTEALFQNVLAHYPDSSYVAYNNLGNMHRVRGELDLAVEQYLSSLKIRPHARTWANLGAAYRRQGRLNESRDAYVQALDLDEESPEAHAGLALLHEAEGKTVGAEAAYREAIRVDPTYEEAHINLGSLLLKFGRGKEAIESYRRGIELNPLLGDAWYNLAVAYSQLGQDVNAIAAYERAIGLQPGSISARINLGALLAKAGRTDDAISQFRQVLRIDPGNRVATSALRQLGAL
jgi:tetratricopeptide (TPR) repeat protein